MIMIHRRFLSMTRNSFSKMSDLFIRYPSTDGLRVTLNNSETLKSFNEIKLQGTVKIHGTNGSVVFLNDGTWFCQSRNRRLSLTSDNLNFCKFIHDIGNERLQNLLKSIHRVASVDTIDKVVVFGEFAGKGINSTVAVVSVPRFWAIFGIQMIEKDGKERWLPLDEMKHVHDNESRIFNVTQFEMFSSTIDFGWDEKKITEAVEKMTELTLRVEQSCPAGKFFGVEGLGEGIVWSNADRSVCFKTKGEKHAQSTKLPKTPEGEKGPEHAFAALLVKEGRLQQGIDYLREMNHELSIKSAGTFVNWVRDDIQKEEQDLIDKSIFASGKNNNALKKAMNQMIMTWYKNYLNEHTVDVVLSQLKNVSTSD